MTTAKGGQPDTRLYTVRMRADLGGSFEGTQWAASADDAVRMFCGRHFDTDGDLYDAAVEGIVAGSKL